MMFYEETGVILLNKPDLMKEWNAIKHIQCVYYKLYYGNMFWHTLVI